MEYNLAVKRGEQLEDVRNAALQEVARNRDELLPRVRRNHGPLPVDQRAEIRDRALPAQARARELLQQRGAVTALGSAVERQGTEIASQLELQQKALALQLQMLQRMGAQVEAAAAAALEDARTKPKRGSAPHRPSYTQGTMVSDARVQMRH